MAASMVTCYSMVAAVLVKKPVMVGKVLSVTPSLTAKESSIVEEVLKKIPTCRNFQISVCKNASHYSI